VLCQELDEALGVIQLDQVQHLVHDQLLSSAHKDANTLRRVLDGIQPIASHGSRRVIWNDTWRAAAKKAEWPTGPGRGKSASQCLTSGHDRTEPHAGGLFSADRITLTKRRTSQTPAREIAHEKTSSPKTFGPASGCHKTTERAMLCPSRSAAKATRPATPTQRRPRDRAGFGSELRTLQISRPSSSWTTSRPSSRRMA